MSVAWLFPGQGSQYVGMASEWARVSPAAAQALDEASETLGFDLAALMADGPEATLADTYNQQPAVLAASVAIQRAAADLLPPPAFVAGHSLGEYSALVAASALDYPDALRLVRERGRLMRLAGEQGPGRMAAVLGLSDETVSDVCGSVDGAQVANYNAPGQVVVSGTRDGVDRACELLEAEGARRIVPLPITIAAHSALMAPVSDAFVRAVSAAPLRDAAMPVMANTSARPITDAAALRAELSQQLTSSVLWSDSMRALIDAGVRSFYEVGPGNVLTGLAKRVLRAEGVEPELLRSLSEPAA